MESESVAMTNCYWVGLICVHLMNSAITEMMRWLLSTLVLALLKHVYTRSPST